MVKVFGNYTNSIDDKNRVLIPYKFREQLGTKIYGTIGLDHTFELRDEKTFDLWQSKLLENNMLSKDAREFVRFLLGNTIEFLLDSQGRILISKHFLEMANITKEVTFVGLGDKVELWDAQNYKEFQEKSSNNKTLERLAEKLSKLGANY